MSRRSTAIPHRYICGKWLTISVERFGVELCMDLQELYVELITMLVVQNGVQTLAEVT